MKKKIPKNIHYVWVGNNEKSELAIACINSWKKHLKDYTFYEWNESSFDVDSNYQVKKALEQKNYAYASDIIRVYALKEYGGIYLDTDVLLLNNLDNLLNNELFLCYESKYWFGSAVIGASKDNPVINLIWERYLNDNEIKFNTNALTVHAFTSALKYLYNFKPNGKTYKFNDIKLLSSDYFYPINYMTFNKKLTNNTIGVHYYNGSWHNKKQKQGFGIAQISRKILGKSIFSLFEKIVANSYHKILNKEFIKIEEKTYERNNKS